MQTKSKQQRKKDIQLSCLSTFIKTVKIIILKTQTNVNMRTIRVKQKAHCISFRSQRWYIYRKQEEIKIKFLKEFMGEARFQKLINKKYNFKQFVML